MLTRLVESFYAVLYAPSSQAQMRLSRRHSAPSRNEPAWVTEPVCADRMAHGLSRTADTPRPGSTCLPHRPQRIGSHDLCSDTGLSALYRRSSALVHSTHSSEHHLPLTTTRALHQLSSTPRRVYSASDGGKYTTTTTPVVILLHLQKQSPEITNVRSSKSLQSTLVLLVPAARAGCEDIVPFSLLLT